MKSVLFTPAGSGIAVTGIKALNRHDDVRTVGTDIDELAPGLHLSDVGYIVPEFGDEEYMDAIVDIVKREAIDVVVPSLDPILERFAANRGRLNDHGASVMVSPADTLAVTQDKWHTYEKLSGRLPFPKSWLSANEIGDEGDYFIKPRRGSGSEGAHHVTSGEELNFYLDRVSDPIIQEYLPGPEYTIDCLTDEQGDLLAYVPRKRIEMTGGISTKVAVVDDDRLRQLAAGVADAVRFTGPFFVQAKADSDGKPRITEIGARIAGTMWHGFVSPSLQYLSVTQLCDEQLPEPTVKYGAKMSRYWSEMTFPDGFDALERW